MLIILYALIPALLIASIFYYLDKNREPVKIIMRAFFLGMFSVLLVFILHLFNPVPYPPRDGSFTSSLIISFYHAGTLEEIAKFVVFAFGIYSLRYFDEWYDGILYGVMIGLGFAFVENIDYFRRLLAESGVMLIVARSFLSMPLHALVGGIMGFFIGKARFTRDKKKAPLLIFFALIVPILIHGLFDFVLFWQDVQLAWVSIPLVGYMWVHIMKLKKISQA